jgi:hypothetical protein
MIKIALNLKEDNVAAVIVARFPVSIDESTFNYSIQALCMNFLHNLFLYEKTEIQKITAEEANKDYEDMSEDDFPKRKFTIDELITKINEYFGKKEIEEIY